jgi:HEAT repeat protein
MASLKAEEAAYRGMALAPTDERFPVLIASIFFQQQRTVDYLSQSLQTNKVSRPDLASMTTTIATWNAHMAKNLSIAGSIGATRLAKVLEKAMLDQKSDVAAEAIQALQKSLLYRDLPRRKAPEEEKDQALVVDTTILKPLHAALTYPNRVVSIKAANCLLRLGYPATGGHYDKLLPKLIEGASENAPPVLLLISNNLKLCREYERILPAAGVRVETATSGRNGLRSALRFPPKDAILIDGSIDEFAYLKSRLAIMPQSKNAVLPMTLITSRERVQHIVDQFPKKAYRTDVITGMKPDTDNLFEKLVSRKSAGTRTQVFILAINSREQRVRMKRLLVEKSQALINPMNDSSIQLGLSNDLHANIYLDEELSGYDANRTLIALRSDPRTRDTTVGLLYTSSTKKRLNEDFKNQLKKKKQLRLVSMRNNADDISHLVKEMSKNRDAKQTNYIRNAAIAISRESSEALSQLNVEGDRATLKSEQVEDLKEILRTRADEETRIHTAAALGHFRATEALPLLAKIAQDNNPTLLRTACIKAIGEIDQKGTLRQFKLDLLHSDPDPAVQAAAAGALSREHSTQDQTLGSLGLLRVSNPATFQLTTPAPTPAKPAEEAQPEEEEEVEEEE